MYMASITTTAAALATTEESIVKKTLSTRKKVVVYTVLSFIISPAVFDTVPRVAETTKKKYRQTITIHSARETERERERDGKRKIF
jgi:hypothetical protein